MQKQMKAPKTIYKDFLDLTYKYTIKPSAMTGTLDTDGGLGMAWDHCTSMQKIKPINGDLDLPLRPRTPTFQEYT